MIFIKEVTRLAVSDTHSTSRITLNLAAAVDGAVAVDPFPAFVAAVVEEEAGDLTPLGVVEVGDLAAAVAVAATVELLEDEEVLELAIRVRAASAASVSITLVSTSPAPLLAASEDEDDSDTDCCSTSCSITVGEKVQSARVVHMVVTSAVNVSERACAPEPGPVEGPPTEAAPEPGSTVPVRMILHKPT